MPFNVCACVNARIHMDRHNKTFLLQNNLIPCQCTQFIFTTVHSRQDPIVTQNRRLPERGCYMDVRVGKKCRI